MDCFQTFRLPRQMRCDFLHSRPVNASRIRVHVQIIHAGCTSVSSRALQPALNRKPASHCSSLTGLDPYWTATCGT